MRTITIKPLPKLPQILPAYLYDGADQTGIQLFIFSFQLHINIY